MIIKASDYENLRQTADHYAHRLANELQTSLRDLVGFPQGAHSISWRVKAPQAIARKLAATHETRINDYIGIRLLCAHPGLIQHISKGVTLAARTAGLIAVRSQQRGAQNERHEYSALHLDFVTSDLAATGLTEDIGVEVQVMTWLQFLVAGLAHDLTYKPARGDAREEDREFLRRTALALRAVDHDIESFLSSRTVGPSDQFSRR